MGTRAAFFVGDPRDINDREWLGCVNFDGYPDGVGQVPHAKTEDEFRLAVAAERSERKDFTDPKDDYFPFPWQDDLFLTDCVYAFFDGKVWLSWFHRGFYDPFDPAHESDDGDDPTLKMVKAPGTKAWDIAKDDSIIVVGMSND